MIHFGYEMLIGALVSGTFGFGGLTSPWTGVARILCVVLLVGFVVMFLREMMIESAEAWLERAHQDGEDGVEVGGRA